VNEFYVTFGQQYAIEPHPLGWPHPDGWLTIVAENEDMARKCAYALLEDRWSFMYSEEDFDPTFYPLKELYRVRFTTEGVRHD